MLIQKGANINTNVTRAPSELDKFEEEEQKEKKKYWLWKPVRPSPPTPTVKSLLREIIDHEWQGVTFLAMDRLDRFQMSYANAVQVRLTKVLPKLHGLENIDGRIDLKAYEYDQCFPRLTRLLCW